MRKWEKLEPKVEREKRLAELEVTFKIIDVGRITLNRFKLVRIRAEEERVFAIPVEAQAPVLTVSQRT